MANVKETMQKLQPKEQMKEAVREVIEEQQQSQQQSDDQQQDPEQQKVMHCVADASNARIVCLQTEAYCLAKGEKMADAQLMSMLHDCIDLCDATAQALIRGSKLRSDIAKLCRRACQETVKKFEDFKDDQQVQTLTQYLNQCAKSCNDI